MVLALRSAALSALLLITALASPRSSVDAAEDPLVVIVSASTGLTNITLPALRRAFSGAPIDYEAGKRFIPLNAPADAPERVKFDRAVLGMTPDEVGRYWVDQRIRGKTQPPRVIANTQLAVRVVASLPGAITYVRASLVNATVRALTIDGRGPAEDDYLLRDD